MAGRRRRGTAAASAVNLLTELMAHDLQEKRNYQRRAAELHEKFQQEKILEAIHRGALVVDPVTGETSAAPPPSIPEGLSPESYTDPASGVRYGRQTEKFLSPDDEADLFYNPRAGRAFQGGAIPISPEGRSSMNRAIEMGLTESPSMETGPTQQQVVRYGTDTQSGRRVAELRDGSVVFAD